MMMVRYSAKGLMEESEGGAYVEFQAHEKRVGKVINLAADYLRMVELKTMTAEEAETAIKVILLLGL